MTRGVVSKRPRLGNNTSPVSLSTAQPASTLPYSSRPFPAPSHSVNGTGSAITTARPASQSQHLLSTDHHPPPSGTAQDTHRAPLPPAHRQDSSSVNHHPPRPSGLVITTPQQPAPRAGPSPTVSSASASFPPPTHADRYQRSAPPSATQTSFPPAQAPATNLPPLASPSTVPPGGSTSAPPFLAHPHSHPPPADYYGPRGPYPGPHSAYPPGTPTTSSFASRQQSAPSGAPPPGHQMIMDHPPPHHHHPPYGHGMYPGEPGTNGAVHSAPHPGAPPPYQPVQPVDQYGAPQNGGPQHYAAPTVPATEYHAGANASSTWSAQQKAGGPKKHTRALVACDTCRARKQKCDEAAPSCTYCLGQNLPCEYRQVQPAKADRNLATIQDAQVKLGSDFKDMKSDAAEMRSDMAGMRSDMAAILNLLKRNPDAAPVNGQSLSQAQSAGLASEQTEELEFVQEQEPGAHSTGAQHLSKKFPLIEPWFRAAGVSDYEGYPYLLEQQRGTPRIYSAGWSGDERTTGNDRDTSYNNSFHGSHTSKNKGGLNPNGSLRLDQATVKRYHDSYMRIMWVIYPILDAEELKQRINTFCSLYSPDEDAKTSTPRMSQYPAYSPRATSANLKRSFSEMQGDVDDSGHSPDPKRPVDASLNNAVILLILALGKLCEHDKYIMAEDLVGKSEPFPEDAGSQGSSPHYPRPSSTRSMQSASSPKFPVNMMNNTQSWQDMYVPPNAKNVYKLPGLAYYAEAASILGQTMGRRGMDAIHAYILAGLYWGQLGHVLQSADWIHMAANSVVELHYSFSKGDLAAPETPEHVQLFRQRPLAERNTINLFLIAWWTVQQMEGDILAELERLPTSRLGGLLQFNGKPMGMPRDLVGVPNVDSLSLFNGAIDTTYILYHFLNQLMLRKYLNRAHLSLYGTQEQQREAATGRQKGLSWADLQPHELWDTVQNWRAALPPPLQWSDSEPPPSDILQARLRAKYYGFVYIVSRKVLENVARNNLPLDAAEYERVQHATLDELRDVSMQSVAAGCKRCILSAIASTVAFDNICEGTRKRAMLPNIMGTFTAQFSNMLVLSYCYLDPRLRGLIPSPQIVIRLLQRTIRLLHNLSPLSPVFDTNKEILLKAYEAVSAEMLRTGIKLEQPNLDGRSNNLVVGNTWPTPPNYGSPGVQSNGRSSQGPGTPRFDHITSANTSFNVPR